MKTHFQRGSISLLSTAMIMMLVTLAGLVFLYTARYGHLPLQDVWSRWSQSAAVISNELKHASGMQKDGTAKGVLTPASVPANAPDSGMRTAATVDSGIRRCRIHGKVVYSDTECADSNPTTRAIKLNDNTGFDTRKKPVVDKNADADPEQDLRMKMIDRMTK